MPADRIIVTPGGMPTDHFDGKDGELLLLLDNNQERSVSSQRSKKTTNGKSKQRISMKDAQLDDDQEANQVFIHTLKTFSGFGGGS